MDSCGDPVELVAQNSEELNAIIAEIERTPHADANNPAPIAAAARPPPSSLYEEMLRFQEEHAEEALSLINGLQDNVESGELVRNVSVNSADDAKPAAFPQGVFRQPIARNYFARKSLIDSSSHSDMVPLSPKSDASASIAAQNAEQGRPEYSRIEGAIDNDYTFQATDLTSQTTADIIKMLLENEKGESKNQRSDHDSDETLARQLHDVFNGSWSKSRQSVRRIDSEGIGSRRQLSGTSALLDEEDNDFAEDINSDESLRSRQYSHNGVAHDGLPLQFDVKTYVSASIQRAASMEETSDFQPQRTNFRQQHLLTKHGTVLNETLTLESSSTELSAPPVRSSFNVEELSHSLSDMSPRKDLLAGAQLRGNNIGTAQHSVVIRPLADQHDDSVIPLGPKESNRSTDREVQIDSTSVSISRVPRSEAFVDSTKRGHGSKTWGRAENFSCKVGSEISGKEAHRTTHAHNARTGDNAAEADESGKHRPAADTDFSSTCRHVPALFRPAVQNVRCQSCFQNLQTLARYQRVHCPVCGTVSPFHE